MSILLEAYLLFYKQSYISNKLELTLLINLSFKINEISTKS